MSVSGGALLFTPRPTFFSIGLHFIASKPLRVVLGVRDYSFGDVGRQTETIDGHFSPH